MLFPCRLLMLVKVNSSRIPQKEYSTFSPLLDPHAAVPSFWVLASALFHPFSRPRVIFVCVYVCES